MSRTERMDGAVLFWKTLHRLGLRTVFGLPGGQTVPLYDALRRSRLRTVLSTSELAAAFAANGYFRAAGRPAAVATIAGPGVVMAGPGLCEALHDSAGLLHLTVSSGDQRPPFDLQRIDLPAFAACCAKELIRIDAVDDIVEGLSRAWRLARSEEPGPVIVQCALPALADATVSRPPEAADRRKTDDADLDEVAARLASAALPVLFCGQGCLDRSDAVVRLAESRGTPVLTTCSGRGVVSEDHPLSIPVDFSNASWRAAQSVFDRADLILALGCKLSHNGSAGFRLKLAQEKLIRVDASAAVLDANYPASMTVEADLSVFLPALAKRFQERQPGAAGWERPKLAELRNEALRRARENCGVFPRLSGARPPTLEAFFAALRELLADDAILVTDSGLHQAVLRALWRVRRERGLVVPSDFQSMGYGVPAALGAVLAAPDRPVVAVVGDGGFSITGMELAVAVREGLDATVIVFSDGALGQIRFQQLSDTGTDHAVKLARVDFESFARSIGASYARLDGNPIDSLRSALTLPGPRLIELPLVDAPQLRRLRQFRQFRRQVRRAIGPGAAGWLRSVRGRS